MVDFFGKELVLNDYVVFTRPKYRDLIIGKVIKFTPRFIKVAYKPGWADTPFIDTHTILSGDVVKVDPEEAIVMKLRGQLDAFNE